MIQQFYELIDSDFDPIPHTENIWLPKEFGDRKHLTAYVRSHTRNYFNLRCQITSSPKDFVKTARENGFKGEELKEFENNARLSQLEVEYGIKFQDKLIESEHGEVFPEKPPSFPFIVEEIDID